MRRIYSIRWQLPLSYAAIACLAAVALGAVLLAILRDYYAQREHDYLRSNADAFAGLLWPVMGDDGQEVNRLGQQLENVAFFANIRIRVLDTGYNVLFDTGEVHQIRLLEFNELDQAEGDPERAEGRSTMVSVRPLNNNDEPENVAGDNNIVPRDILVELPRSGKYIDRVKGEIAVPLPAADFGGGEPEDPTVRALNMWTASRSFYGFELGASMEVDRTLRSDQQVQRPVLSPDGQVLGYIEVSDGPAYGTVIVEGVAHGWVLSGVIAVLLAALVGWFASHRLSAPLLALKAVTVRMAEGDLSARADLDTRRDELGVLAHSFNVMAARIEQTVVTLTRFVADAAHELHTPITALRTNLELASSGDNPVSIARAQHQVLRLAALTDDLLDLSRIEAHTDSAELEPVALIPLLRATSEVYASQAEQAGVDYALDLPAKLPVVPGNPHQLQRLVDNLLENAIKFTPEGGRVAVSVQAGNGCVVLQVSDTGIGIPSEDLPQLFGRFRRGRNAQSYSGSGLGLAIVQAIVDGHGGTVEATSSEEGTCMTVRLPALKG